MSELRELLEGWDIEEAIIDNFAKLRKDDIVWLKINSEPWEDVINKWKATYELRQQLQYETVEAYIENWPILKDVRSDVLIRLDFDAIHPGRENKFHVLWNEFIEKIVDKKIPNLKEEVADLVHYINGIVDDDHKLPSQIKLLCKLVPPKGRLNKRQKFSITECTESFIVTVKTPGDIQKKIDEISTDASGKRKTVQPYIIHCTSVEDIGGTIYLIIDKVRYSNFQKKMQCSICKTEYHDFKTYFIHLNYFHNITDYFKCPYQNCARAYNTKSSLKKHVCTQHFVPNENNVCTMTEAKDDQHNKETYVDPGAIETDVDPSGIISVFFNFI